ncbi:VOC family protein [Aerococcaceae bacterium WGS1372]
MYTDVEIDFVVRDSLKALEEYQAIFKDELEVVEQTSFDQGLNEVVFNLYGVRFNLLDENHEYHLFAPTADNPNTIWFNIVVPNIQETFSLALEQGATVIQNLTEMKAMGVINAMFLDNSHYIWMLHQIHRDVSFEER